MPVRINGGVFDDQMISGSLAHYILYGADFSGAIDSFGHPVPNSAAEIIFVNIADSAYIDIMNPTAENISFALEEDRSTWDADSLTLMVRALGSDVGVDHIDCSVCTVERVPYIWGLSGSSVTTTDTFKGNTVIVPLDSDGTTNIGPLLPAGCIITCVRVMVTFVDTSALLEVGIIGDTNKYMVDTENNMQVLGIYIAETFVGEATAVQVVATVSDTAATVGAACVVLVEYKLPA